MKKVFLAALVAFVALPLGALLAPPGGKETPLGEIRFQVEPALRGGGSLYIPVADWGLRWDIHEAPFLVRSEIRSIDREGLLQAATSEDIVLRASEDNIRDGVLSAITRTWLWGILLAALAGLCLALLWPGLGPWFQAWTAGAALLLGGILFGTALLTHSPEKLEQPSFYARGEEISQILDAVSRQGEDGSYEDNFRKTLSDISAFLTDRPAVSTDRGAVLASDLHSNALALPALRDLVSGDPLFFVGDFGLEGNDAEAALLAEDIAGLSKQVVAVSGNHDSETIMLALARAGVDAIGTRGILQPDGSWQEGSLRVEGLLVRGWSDPLEWEGEPGDPERNYSFSPGSRVAAERDLWAWWRGLSQKPDILLVHQAALAESLVGHLRGYPRPLTILVGHDHEQWVARSGNIRMIDAGSVGAGGLFGFGKETAELAEIYFSPATQSVQIADMIQVSPLDSQASAQRVAMGRICQLPCRYSIKPLP